MNYKKLSRIVDVKELIHLDEGMIPLYASVDEETEIAANETVKYCADLISKASKDEFPLEIDLSGRVYESYLPLSVFGHLPKPIKNAVEYPSLDEENRKLKVSLKKGKTNLSSKKRAELKSALYEAYQKDDERFTITLKSEGFNEDAVQSYAEKLLKDWYYEDTGESEEYNDSKGYGPVVDVHEEGDNLVIDYWVNY